MNPFAIILTSFSALKENRLRSGLTLLGLIIGTGSVVAILAFGQSVQDGIFANIAQFGANLIYVRSNSNQLGETVFSAETGQLRQRGVLTLDDVDQLSEWPNAPSVELVATSSGGFGVVWVVGTRASINQSESSESLFNSGPGRSGGGFSVGGGNDGFVADDVTSFFASVFAVNESYAEAFGYDVIRGSFLSSVHVQNRSMVVVLGDKIAQDLFGKRDPVGSVVAFEGKHLTVIGVIDGDEFSQSSTSIFIPITTRLILFGEDPSSVRIASGGQVEIPGPLIAQATQETLGQAEQELQNYLRVRFGEFALEDFEIETQEELVREIRNATAVFTLFLGSIAAVSLLVGGIGIMNTMLVSVSERTREIGLRRALGAKKLHILIQFVIEAVTISLIGGVVGVVFGQALATIGASVEGFGPPGVDIPTPPIQLSVVFLALGVSAGIGLFFGIYPAIRAAFLHPIDALRRE